MKIKFIRPLATLLVAAALAVPLIAQPGKKAGIDVPVTYSSSRTA
jgi:hypothetical protein